MHCGTVIIPMFYQICSILESINAHCADWKCVVS